MTPTLTRYVLEMRWQDHTADWQPSVCKHLTSVRGIVLRGSSLLVTVRTCTTTPHNQCARWSCESPKQRADESGGGGGLKIVLNQIPL